ncbi:hypothetical protein F5Y19DRAFT_419489 [Xylariaceae sp. FL1651]|nr:hypothetical protein F5Y19DRAFT_419489 [Xylariaceae sp. FL1651]
MVAELVAILELFTSLVVSVGCTCSSDECDCCACATSYSTYKKPFPSGHSGECPKALAGRFVEFSAFVSPRP